MTNVNLSWNEIKTKATAFVHVWHDATDERQQAQDFMRAFFDIFGINKRSQNLSFERKVKIDTARQGYIDAFIPKTILVEMKSRGKSLDSAFEQASGYFNTFAEEEKPRFILVSDFARFRLYDLDKATKHEFLVTDLLKHIELFGPLAGYEKREIKEDNPLNIKAAELMGKLHDDIKATGYTGHDLEMLLVRLLFCLFAEDTGLFERGQFATLISNRTREDGSDLFGCLNQLFDTLNRHENERLNNLDEELAAFPYVNGKLFSDPLRTAQFNASMRQNLLAASSIDWGSISPAIFGALFQSIMNEETRRNLGAHYTSERNILKLINPLFMDELREEFETTKRNRTKLAAFHEKLASLKFFDPACGCGNFLVVAYRELRELELQILKTLYPDGLPQLDIAPLLKCNVDQFYGIEIEEFPAQIAQVALWLVDHQMNQRVAFEFGRVFNRLPLRKSATIHHNNALTLDWKQVLTPTNTVYVLGNPPFLGKQYQSTEQKTDLSGVVRNIKGAGVLDFVCGWYVKAADYIQNTHIRCAFVSTNSITQGEQVGILWGHLLSKGIQIHFAHRTFQWTNEARGIAAVHCVIIGFGLAPVNTYTIFDYENIKGEPQAKKVSRINPYLVDAPNVVLIKRTQSISHMPTLVFGNMPNDGGFLLLSTDEKNELLAKEPQAEPWIRKFLGAEEFLNGKDRYCLWLVDCPPDQLRNMPVVMQRLDKVKETRLLSTRETTRELADTPTLFGEIRQTDQPYLLVPRVSSENRQYIPCGYFPASLICGDANFMLPNAATYHFGVLSSSMHMAWVRYVCGRLKSDFRYSNTIVYNNFPWPEKITGPQQDAISKAAQAVLDARKNHPTSTLADLYDPIAMPPDLRKAHNLLDAAVDKAYTADGGSVTWKSDAERVAFLFTRYQALVAPLDNTGIKKKKAKK